jgi:hypothetical protein
MVYKTNPKNLKIISFGRIAAGVSYPSIRKALEDKTIKDGFAKLIGDVCYHIKNKNHIGMAGAGEEVTNALLKYPKIALERNFEPPTDYENIFLEEGTIKLPFPKIVIIVGQYEMPDRIIKNDGSSSVNRLAYYIVSQDNNGIIIHAIAAETPDDPLHIVSTEVTVMPDESGKLIFLHGMQQGQYDWIDTNTRRYIVMEVMHAIYMMTYHTGEVYISVPTPRDVAVNEKKVRKGKKPLIEFRLISITAKKRDLPSIPQGTHASPRQHWRRGHWRTYKSGKRAWVEPMLVGDEKNGKIVKDYVIGHYDEDKRNGTMRASKTPSQSQYHAPI